MVKNWSLHLIIVLISATSTAGVCVFGQEIKSRSNKPAWIAKILEASQPDTVRIDDGSISKKPSENYKWLCLTLTLSKPTSKIALKQIKVVDDSSRVYPALAIGQMKESPTFIFFDDLRSGFPGFVVPDAEGKLWWMVNKDAITGSIDLNWGLAKQQTVEALFLFVIPNVAKSLYLQVEENTRVPIKIIQSAK